MLLSSNRVLQLKKEIEELDNKLLNTNTINFEEIRHSLRNYNEVGYGSSDEERFTSGNKHQTFEIEDEILRQSQGQISNLASSNLRQSANGLDMTGQSLNERRIRQKTLEENQNRVQTTNKSNETMQSRNFGQAQSIRNSDKMASSYNINLNEVKHPLIDTSLFSHDGEVSFDLEKIIQKRNLNIKTAFESNLKEKQDFINGIQDKVFQIKKECEAKMLKLTHLKYERENIINQIQVDSIKKQEQIKDAKDQLKKIEIKKREDERAYSMAQNEIKRCIAEQEMIIQELLDSISTQQSQIKQYKQIIDSRSANGFQTISNELQERISQQQLKIQSLTNKKQDVEQNVQILKDFLKSISEEIQMTQEDLNGKLMQRAEFVAQREELDQMYETGKQAFGKSFEIFLRINDITIHSGLNSTRHLQQEYEQQKAIEFYQSLLQQMKQSCKTKYHEKIDQVQQRIENTPNGNIDTDKCLSLISNLAFQLGMQIEPKVLKRKLDHSNQERDQLFEQRQSQLREILSEIKRFEKLIKENSNLVDNMIIPQLKAMSATYNEHKGKYKKLKQAQFVLKERLKKAERDMASLNEEKSKYQAQQSVGSKLKAAESEIKLLQERLQQQQDEMDRLSENASQIEREFRRAQQALNLKEREIMHKLGNEQRKSLNATSLSASLSQKQDNEDERLKKRFVEIEDKIKTTLKEKDEANKKLDDYSRLLKEAQESLEHAQQMMLSTQRIIEKNGNQNSQQQKINPNFNTLPNNRRHYQSLGNNQKLQGQKTEDYSHEYQMTSVTDSDNDQISNMGSSSQSSLIQKQMMHQNTKNQTVSQRPTHQKSNSTLDGSRREKENPPQIIRQQKINRDFMTKIDLTKVLAQKDNNSHSQQNSITTPVQLKDFTTNQSNSINFMNDQSTYYQSQGKNVQLSKQIVINKDFINKVCSKDGQQLKNLVIQSQNATTGTDNNQLNEEILNFLQQTKCLDESQQITNSGQSVLNLSDLIINNEALRDYIRVAVNQDCKEFSEPGFSNQLNNRNQPVSQITFNNTQNSYPLEYNQYQNNHLQDSKNTNDLSESQMMYRGSGFINDNTLNYSRINESVIIHNDLNKSQNYQFNGQSSEKANDSGPMNQSHLVDNSILNYLDELNQNNCQSYSQQQRIKPSYDIKKKDTAVLKRSSIETADFFNHQEDMLRKQTHTIEVDLTNRYQLEHHQNFVAPISPEVKGEKKRMSHFNKSISHNQDGYTVENRSQLSLGQSINFRDQSMISGFHSYNPTATNLQKPEFLQQSQHQYLKNNQQMQQRSNSKVNGWMTKYLSNVNDHSRVDNGCLSESISPKPNLRRSSKLKHMSQNWNRSNSLENRYGSVCANANKMNMSINSLTSSNNYASHHNQSCSEAFQYSRSGSRLGKKSKKLNKSLNGIESSMIMQQSINSSVMNPVTMSINFNNLQNSHHQNSCNQSYIASLDFMNFSRIDVSFAERIVPLLDGSAFYKKFSSRQSLNENAFDPLNSDKFPPENCGYGIRIFQLDKSLLCINVKQSLKNAVETSISLNDIVKPILPQTTMDIIRAQKQYLLTQQTNQLRKSSRNGQICNQSQVNSSKDLLEEFLILDTKGSISHLAKIGIVNKNSELYRQKCLDSTFYPFSIALTKGRVELIATSYETLKNWIIGINLLVSNKKHIPKIKQLMELKLD